MLSKVQPKPECEIEVGLGNVTKCTIRNVHCDRFSPPTFIHHTYKWCVY